jgi:DNA repair exonuclease SbcCD ATPase subunit
MDELKLIKLDIQNFKGVTEISLEPDGMDMSIRGDNGTGKTTCADAFSWLFTGKDYQGKADFAIKPLDQGNNEVHNLETVVEGVFTFNGKPITLKKLFKENYTQKKGSTARVFSGHVKEHWVDGIPKKEGEYKAFISDLFDLDTLALVSNPSHFPNMPWAKRRDIVLALVGDVSDADVIASDDDLAPLTNLLDGRSIDDLRALLTSQKKQINKDIQGIPPRISELENQMADIKKPLKKDLDQAEKRLKAAQEELAAAQSSDSLSQKRARLSEVEAEISQAKADAAKAKMDAQGPILEQIGDLNQKRFALRNQVSEIADQMAKDEKRNRLAEDAMSSLRKKWAEEDAKSIDPEQDCPYCSQPMPQAKVDEAVKKFNDAKAERLKSISAEGLELKGYVEDRNKHIDAAKNEISNLQAQIDELDGEITNLQKSMDQAPEKADTDTRKLEQEKAELEGRINAIKNGSKIQEETAREHIQAAQDEINAWNKAMAGYDASTKARARIEELGAQEKALASEFENLEYQLHLANRFIVAKVELLESKINARFSTARFKMFEQQINGGIKPCCEVLHNGVPYNSGLNSAARVNVGLDICQVLSEHYGLQATIWLDNRESVNELHPVNSQVISMTVTGDAELLYVVDNKLAKAS